MLARIAEDGPPVTAVRELPGFGEFVDLVGMGEVEDIAEKYGNG